MGHLDSEGLFNGTFTTYAFSGAVRQRVGSAAGPARGTGATGLRREPASGRRLFWHRSATRPSATPNHSQPVPLTWASSTPKSALNPYAPPPRPKPPPQGEGDSALDLLWRKKQADA